VPDSGVRRLPEVLEGPLARLEESREALAKAWLVRLIERTPLEEIEKLQTDVVARELPELIRDVVKVLRSDDPEEELAPDSDLYRRAARLGELRGGDTPSTYRLARDLAALESVVTTELRRELAGVEDIQLVLDAVERVAEVFRAVQGAAVEELLSNRSRELEWLANTDGLTGLYNVRYLQQHLGYLLGVQQRYGHPFSILLLDVDGLKRINDSFGHAAGDKTLVGVAGALRETIRTVDVPVRMGGDEFCILAPYQTASRAKVLGDRLSEAIEQVRGPNGTPVGISIGVVSCPQHAVDAERLLDLADGAMYRAKAAGARVVVSDPETDARAEVENDA
jgi:diguanylate cyclase (GGDEF)-like protein